MARALFGAAVRRIRKRGVGVVAVSEATKRDVIEYLGFPEDRVSVVHHGVPVHFSHASFGSQQRVRKRLDLDDRPVVLFVGELAERKNVRILVEAFAQARRSVTDARLVLAGSPGLGFADIVATIDRLGVGDAVQILGHAPEAVTEALVAGAELLVLPSQDEGFGFPALEAMSVGTPVIASTAGALPEVVGDAGVLVSPGDVGQLAHEIERLLGDESARDELGRRGSARARTFTWSRAAEQTMEFYAHAIGA